MNEFKMPSLGADMASGTLYEWRIKPGDRVKRGDIVAEVETAKGVIEVEVFVDGVISQILVEEGTEVPVGTVLALIQEEGEIPVRDAPPKSAVIAAETEPHPLDHRPLVARLQKRRGTNGHRRPTGDRLRVSPLARKLANELGVDLAQVEGTGPREAITAGDVEQAAARLKRERPRVTPVARRVAAEHDVDLARVSGTGPHGGITRQDVERAARIESQPAAGADEKAKSEKARIGSPEMMRQAIALAMTRANREIPHYYLETRINMQKSLDWLAEENQKRSIKDRLLPAVLFIKAVAAALEETPALNGYWHNDRPELADRIHIGFAIARRQGGLVTPAIHDANRLTVDGIMAKLRDLIVRTRAGRLRGSELTDATITLTSLGDLGVDKVFGVIYPPQIALVGLGKISERPWAERGLLGVRPVMTATLAGDHRASDGLIGARFLEALNRIFQEVEQWQ